LILLHNFKVFALKIKRGTLALLDQQVRGFVWDPIRAEH
jgi:hypothetical protein